MEELSTKKVSVNYKGAKMEGTRTTVVGSDFYSAYMERHGNELLKIEDPEEKFAYVINNRLFLMRTLMSKKCLTKKDKESMYVGLEVLLHILKDLNDTYETKDPKTRKLIDMMLEDK